MVNYFIEILFYRLVRCYRLWLEVVISGYLIKRWLRSIVLFRLEKIRDCKGINFKNISDRSAAATLLEACMAHVK